LEDLLAVTIDRVWSPNKAQNRRNKQSFDIYAFTIDIVPLVLEKSCFVGQVFEYKWKISKRRKIKKRNADSTTRSQAKAHLRAKSRPSTTMGASQA
jgi:hypothetical protein